MPVGWWLPLVLAAGDDPTLAPPGASPPAASQPDPSLAPLSQPHAAPSALAAPPVAVTGTPARHDLDRKGDTAGAVCLGIGEGLDLVLAISGKIYEPHEPKKNATTAHVVPIKHGAMLSFAGAF